MRAAIREFREDDYEAVLRVWREAGLTIRPSDTLPELRKLIARNPGTFLVAEEAGTVVGTVIGAWDGRRAWGYHLTVLPAVRGRGTGQKLMEELERRLRAIGASKLNLLIEAGNAGAAAFYRKLGYTPGDLLFMTRLLSWRPRRTRTRANTSFFEAAPPTSSDSMPCWMSPRSAASFFWCRSSSSASRRRASRTMTLTPLTPLTPCEANSLRECPIKKPAARRGAAGLVCGDRDQPPISGSRRRTGPSSARWGASPACGWRRG